jgi:hypothetical protein
VRTTTPPIFFITAAAASTATTIVVAAVIKPHLLDSAHTKGPDFGRHVGEGLGVLLALACAHNNSNINVSSYI